MDWDLPPRPDSHTWPHITYNTLQTGGYHADRHCFGPNCPWDGGGEGDGAAFRLYQLGRLIDTFVYFSHSFITIPPQGWTALCHLNGARVLGMHTYLRAPNGIHDVSIQLSPCIYDVTYAHTPGTFITEWEAGAEKCRRIFESQETVERCVEAMVAIAVHHGFEGTCEYAHGVQCIYVPDTHAPPTHA